MDGHWMATRELTDAEIFGTPELSDADVFGSSASPSPRVPMRGREKARYVAPDNPADPIAPTGGSVLERFPMAAPTVDASKNLEAMMRSASPNSVMFSPGRALASVDAKIEKGPPKAAPRAPRPERDAMGVLRDVRSIVGNTAVQAAKPFVDIPNIVVGGLLDPLVKALNNAGEYWGNEASDTTNYDRQTLAQMPEGETMGKVGQIIGNPGLALSMAVPSVASMLLPLGAVKGAAALAPRTALALGDKFATGTAVGANALMNAGDTFGQTNADLGGRLLAALSAGTTSALVGKATGGGLEGQLARGGKVPSLTAALKAVGMDSAQEAGENIGNSLAQDTGEGRPLNIRKALDEGAIGAVLAPIVAGPMNLHQVATSPERINAKLLADAINGFTPASTVQPLDNSMRQPTTQVVPPQEPQSPRKQALIALGYDPEVVNALPDVMIAGVGPESTVAPMDMREKAKIDAKVMSDAEVGLTPDVVRAQQNRSEPGQPSAPTSDLLQRLRAAGWTPPQEGINATPDPETVQGLGNDLEKQYQTDIKDGIKQRLGLAGEGLEPPAPARISPADSPVISAIAKQGIALDERAEIGTDTKRMTVSRSASDGVVRQRLMPNAINVGGKPLYREGGLRGDMLAEKLQSLGYLTQEQIDYADENEPGGAAKLAHEMIARELANPGTLKQVEAEHAAIEGRFEAQRLQELDGAAQRLGIDTRGMSPQHIADIVRRTENRQQRSTEPDFPSRKADRTQAFLEQRAQRVAQMQTQGMQAINELQAQRIIERDQADALDVEGLMRSMGFTEKEISDHVTTEAETSQVPDGPVQAPQGREDGSPAGNIAAETGAAQTDKASAEGLTSYTPADLRARDESIAAQVKAEARQEAEAEQAAKKVREEKEIKARQDASAENFQLGQSADDSLSGQGQMFAESPQLGYDGNYDKDLFGDPLPAASRKARPAGPKRAGVSGDAHAPANVQADIAGAEFYANAFVGSETGRELGASVVITPTQAAQATKYLYKSAVERFDAIVTDKEGKPLGVIGGFKGALAQTAVYPATLMGEAIRIPGAAHIWFSHNHPSGSAVLSRADENLNRTLTDVFNGSGIEPMGLMAIAGDSFSYVNAIGSGMDWTNRPIPTSNSKITVPVMERQMTPGVLETRIHNPSDAKTFAKQFYEKSRQPGILLLDSQMAIAAWVPIPPEMMGPLRGTGQLAALYRAVSQSNAGGAVLAHGGELDVTGDLPGRITAGNNIAAALQKIDVRVVDSINVNSGVSRAETGQDIAAGPLYSKGKSSATDNASSVNSADSTRHALKVRFGPLIDRMEARGLLKIWDDTQQFNQTAQRSEQIEGKAQGLWDGKTAHLFAVAIEPGTEIAVLLHEVGEHASMQKMLGPQKYSQLVARARALVHSDDATALEAVSRIPEDTRPEFLDSELLAYMIETVAAKDAKASPGARKWLADIIAAIRAWWTTTALSSKLERYGQKLDLTPEDIAALAVRAVKWQGQQDGQQQERKMSRPPTRAQIDTQAFKDWFGDSKVVDDEGKPLVVYHGTPTGDLAEFRNDAKRNVMAFGDAQGHYFTSDPTVASNYGEGKYGSKAEGYPAVMPAYLSLKNPKIFTVNGFEHTYISPTERKKLEGEGFDGVIYRDANDPRDDEYIVFTSEQIKSALGNNGEFDATNPDIRYSRPKKLPSTSLWAAPPGSPPVNPNTGNTLSPQPWTVADPARLDAITRHVQNNRIDIKRTVDAIKGAGQKIADDANPYLKDELYIGRVRDQLDRLADDRITPMLRAVANSGIEVKDVNRYLWARHAEERNRQMAKVNQVAFTPSLDLAGMSTATAQADLASYAARPDFAKLQRIAAMVDRITKDTRQHIISEGLEDRATIQAWEGAYKNYVPLQRDIEESGGKAQGYNVKGSESRRAVGSKAEAVNILANVIAQAESAIIRAEKARVGRSVLALAEQNPNPDFWTVDTPPTERVIDPKTGVVTKRVVPNFKNAENTFVVKQNGVERYVIFNDRNPRAVQFVRNLKNLDVSQMGPVVAAIGIGTRYLAQWVTARNPLFWLTNFTRDIQEVAFNLQSTPLKGQAMETLSRVPATVSALAMDAVGKRGGKLQARVDEYNQSGAKTGFMLSYENSVERMGEITKEIERMQRPSYDPRRVGRGLLDVIDGANDVIENGVRLAVFVQAREEGISIDKAASVAKNISVNFNRKGNGSSIVNALYMFANANVQGHVRMLQGVATSRTAQMYAGAMVAAGAAMTMLNWAISGDDDESRKRRYALVPQHERERNWILFYPNSDKYIKVPLPIGPSSLFNAGRVLAEMMLDPDAKPLDKAGSFVSSLLGSFNPIGGGLPTVDTKGAAQVLTPSIVRPIVDIAVNQNFAGTPISKENLRPGYKPPNYTMGRENTPEHWKSAAHILNDWTGGDKVKAGSVNVTPEQIAYLLKSYITPGISPTVDKAASLATGRKEVKVKDLPGVNKFFGEVDETNRARAAFDTAKKDQQRLGEYKKYIAEGDRENARQVLKEWGAGDEANGRKLLAQATSYDKIMASLRKEHKGLNQVPVEEVRNKRLAALDERMNRANAVYLSNTRDLRRAPVATDE